jgi:hypothetical protein
MRSKLVSSLSKSVCCTLFLVATLFLNTSNATTWGEVGDASDLLNIAQIPTGSGSIDTITGSITTSFDVDLYKIKIINPTAFSAFVFGGEGPNDWDSMLTLFDENGFGVYRNDDAVFDIGDSGLPANHALGPQVAGNYFLAISDDDRGPLSGTASSINDLIFPSSTFPYTDISGPTGSGGALALTDWGSLISEVTLNANYGINLTGAEFVSSAPIPAAFWLFGTGIIGFLGLKKKVSD